MYGLKPVPTFPRPRKRVLLGIHGQAIKTMPALTDTYIRLGLPKMDLAIGRKR